MPIVHSTSASKPKDGEQLHIEAVLRKRVAHEIFQRDHVVDRNVAVGLGDGAGNRIGKSKRRDRGANGERELIRLPRAVGRISQLRSRPVEGRDSCGAVQALLAHVAHNTNHHAFAVGIERELQMMAECALVRPELVRHGLADDHH